MIFSFQGVVTASSPTLKFTLTPNDDLTDKVCELRVHQASMQSSATTMDKSYAVIRCPSWSQPRSVKLHTGSLNDVIYILHHSYPTTGPPLRVYVPPGEQTIQFTVDNLGVDTYTLTMLISLV